jgi:hypothetical protein
LSSKRVTRNPGVNRIEKNQARTHLRKLMPAVLPGS